MIPREKRASEFVSTREAAQLLGVALRTVQLWVEAGVLSAWKTAGGHRRVVRSSIDTLLQQKADALAAVAPAPKSSRGKRSAFRVLVVEDEKALLKLYELHIAGWDLPLELLTATNGFECLLRIGESRPDLVITDLLMPGMDGFRMLRSLHTNPDYRGLDIIVVTALGKHDIADRGGLPPNVKVFTKPISFAELERLVRAKIARAAAGRAEPDPAAAH
jgi:excisionase family DNA binding protein